MSEKTRLAVFVSGSGTNLQAIIDAEISTVDIVLVVSNNPEAFALERIKKYHIPSLVIDHRKYSGREEFERRLLESIRPYKIDLIVLAGFMRILSPFFVREYKSRIMNIHPAILPSFPGVGALKRHLSME